MKLLQTSRALGLDEMLKCLSNRSGGGDSQTGPPSSAALPKKRKQPDRSQSRSERSSGGQHGPAGTVRALVPHRNGYDDSPYYFRGESSAAFPLRAMEEAEANGPGTDSAKSHAGAASSAVFVKVWREGDSRTSRRGVESEMELLSLANRAGVPLSADRLGADPAQRPPQGRRVPQAGDGPASQRSRRTMRPLPVHRLAQSRESSGSTGQESSTATSSRPTWFGMLPRRLRPSLTLATRNGSGAPPPTWAQQGTRARRWSASSNRTAAGRTRTASARPWEGSACRSLGRIVAVPAKI
jgi:hypothetical protein